MTQIRIDTERVREVAQRLLAEGERVADLGSQLQGAMGSLDTWAWDGVSRARAEPMLGRVRPESGQVAEELAAMGHILLRVADTFEQEDATAARNLEGMPWVDWDDGGGGPLGGSRTPPDEDPDFRRVRGADEAEYGPVPGQLFIHGAGEAADVDQSDVGQGQIGDCYFMAALASIAQQNPDFIRNMVRSNQDGTYTVTFYRRVGILSPELEPVEVVVRPEFPLVDGIPRFANPGDTVDGQHELWPMVLERGYAQFHGGYDEIVGGYGHRALRELTGVPSSVFHPPDVSIDALAEHMDSGHAVTVSSLRDWAIRDLDGEVVWDIPDASDRNPWYQGERSPLVGNHEFAVLGVDAEAGTVTLRNPWVVRPDPIVMPYEDFQEAFRYVSVNPITPPTAGGER